MSFEKIGECNSSNNRVPNYSEAHQHQKDPDTQIAAACPLGPSAEVDEKQDKRFTTAYGMVVWPTLPGLSSATTEVEASHADGPRANTHIHDTHQQAMLPRSTAKATPPSDCGEASYTTASKNDTSNTTHMRSACDACHRMKRKCDGKQPCTRCERRSRDCLYSCKLKSGPPKGSKRKLVEAEDDLPENRCIKPSLMGVGAPAAVAAPWSGSSNESMIPPTDGPNQYSTENVDPAGPSPEARAAAAAAVAASRMNALASAVPPALAAAGLHPPYMLRPPPVLPGLSGRSCNGNDDGGGGCGGGEGGGAIPATTPLVAHPRYGTVYQHQYPPEVYAVYLAELRQRSCNSGGLIGSGNSNNNSNNNNNNGGVGPNCTSAMGSILAWASSTPDPASDRTQQGSDTCEIPPATTTTDTMSPHAARSLRDENAPAPIANISSATAAAAVFLANNATATGATRFTSSERTDIHQDSTDAGKTWSGHASTVRSEAGTGGENGAGQWNNSGSICQVAPDTVALAHVAKMAEASGWEGGANEPAKEAAASAAASAALAAAVAAAIAEGSPSDDDRDGRDKEDCALEPTDPDVSKDGGRDICDGGAERSWTGLSLDVPLPPSKGSRFDAVPETGMAMMPKIDTVITAAATLPEMAMKAAHVDANPDACRDTSSSLESRAAEDAQRERQAAAALLLYGTNSIRSAKESLSLKDEVEEGDARAAKSDCSGGGSDDNGREREKSDVSQRDGCKAATEGPDELNSRGNVPAA